MARIRSLKPELPSDRKLAGASRDARYTFVLLITQADDDGLVQAEPRQILGLLYPYDDDVDSMVLQGWLDELSAIEVIRFRQTRDGVRVIQLVNFERHQFIKNRAKPLLLNTLASPPETLRRPSVDPTEDRGRPSVDPGGADLGSRSLDLGEGSRSSVAKATGKPSRVEIVDNAEPASRVAAAAVDLADGDEPVSEPLTRTAPLARIAGAVRKVWWLPDGEPPVGWAMGRELSIWRRILDSGAAVDDCIAVIHGASYLQHAGGVYARGELELIDWLNPGRLTGRVFKNTRVGAVPIWTLALEAYDRGPPDSPAAPALRPRSGRREVRSGPESLAKLLPR